jgi:hypothetical protein
MHTEAILFVVPPCFIRGPEFRASIRSRKNPPLFQIHQQDDLYYLNKWVFHTVCNTHSSSPLGDYTNTWENTAMSHLRLDEPRPNTKEVIDVKVDVKAGELTDRELDAITGSGKGNGGGGGSFFAVGIIFGGIGRRSFRW